MKNICFFVTSVVLLLPCGCFSFVAFDSPKQHCCPEKNLVEIESSHQQIGRKLLMVSYKNVPNLRTKPDCGVMQEVCIKSSSGKILCKMMRKHC